MRGKERKSSRESGGMGSEQKKLERQDKESEREGERGRGGGGRGREDHGALL